MKKIVFTVLFSVLVSYVFSQNFGATLMNGKNGGFTLNGNAWIKKDNTKVNFDNGECKMNNAGGIESFEGHGNVHGVVKGKNTTNIYSDNLSYDGKTVYKFRNNVRMVSEGKTLYTESLDYDPNKEQGYFTNGGKVVDSTATLESIKGYYYTKDNKYIFVKKVTIYNDKYTLYSDTLHYEMNTKKATVFGPTNIYGKDTTHTYFEYGWYNTVSENAHLRKNAYIQKKNNILRGDSLFYDRAKGVGKAFHKVELIDTTQNLVIKGEKGIYYTKTDKGYITEKAVLTQISKKDTMFLHADTLASMYDSTHTYRIVKAYHHAKIWRINMQAKCDSILYSFKDSVIHLFREPVLWSDGSQLTAQHIKIYTKNRRPDYLVLTNSAFIISQEDLKKFNQIKGKSMKGFFKENELEKIDVLQAAESIYFAKDGDDIVGMNHINGEKMLILLKNKKVNFITVTGKATGYMDPLELVKENEMQLADFKWFDSLRPKDKNDIFIWRELKEK